MPDIDLLDVFPADLYEITRLIAGVESKGSFATEFTVSERGLDIVVDGVGRIPLPVLAATSQRLKRAARPAHYGLKDQTLLDPTVRDSWEIPGDRIEIHRRWQPVLEKALVRVRRDLGLAMDCELEAHLHNLLIYSRGQFFATHQDSEKEDGMIGTLVVGLPSRFSGGEFVIRHHEETLVSTGSESSLSVIAFYADCRHEIRPITSGHRVVLTWNLIVRTPAAPETPPAAPIDVLTRRIQAWFQTPRPARWGGDRDAQPPDRLVYLLDHEYTQRGLGWDQLKNADALRAATLREVAGRLDCEIYLALADVHETWSCEDDFTGFEYGGYSYCDDDDDDGYDDRDRDDDDCDLGDDDDDGYRSQRRRRRRATDFVLTDLIESQIELRHWVTPGRRKVECISVPVDDREVCYTRPSVHCEPFESEHEGYTGNAGNTVDHWYHRAAIVMWPRAHNFVIRAKASASWAIDELARILASDGRDAALAHARQLLPFWPDAVGRGRRVGQDGETPQPERSALLAATLRLIVHLDEAELSDVSGALLASFALVDLVPAVAPDLADLVQARDLEGCRAVLETWLAAPARIGSNEAMCEWLSGSLLVVCSALCAVTPSADGKVLAADILSNRWGWLQRHIEAIGNDANADRAARALLPLGAPLLAMVESCGVADQAGLGVQITGFLAQGLDADRVDAIPLQLPLALFRAASAQGAGSTLPRPLGDLGLESLQQRLARTLADRLTRPGRRADDWSITAPIQCPCELCVTLKGFLRAPQQRRLNWPLAEQRRRHIHGIIDSHGLPVNHATRRQGSPYTLVLEKTAAVFERDAAARRWWAEQLAWIETLSFGVST